MKKGVQLSDRADENMGVIEGSYADYIAIVSDREKEIMARQITLTAYAWIKNRGGDLDSWLRVFSDEEIVVTKLKELLG